VTGSVCGIGARINLVQQVGGAEFDLSLRITKGQNYNSQTETERSILEDKISRRVLYWLICALAGS